MKLFPHLVFLLPYLVFGWTTSQSPFSHCQIKHFIFNLSKISILHRRRMSLWVFLCQSWEPAVGSLFRASHKAGWPFIFMDKLVGLGKQEWGYLWDEHNCSTAIHKRGGRIWCLRSNLGSLEQGEEKGEKMQETNFVMCGMILFLNPQDYQQDLCNCNFETQKKKSRVSSLISMAQNSGYWCKRNRRMTKETWGHEQLQRLVKLL